MAQKGQMSKLYERTQCRFCKAEQSFRHCNKIQAWDPLLPRPNSCSTGMVGLLLPQTRHSTDVQVPITSNENAITNMSNLTFIESASFNKGNFGRKVVIFVILLISNAESYHSFQLYM